MKRFGKITRFAASFALLFVSSLRTNAQSPSTNVPISHAPNPVYDIVAVGRRPGEIVLATPALSHDGEHWRFRRLAIEPKNGVADSVKLSRGGTKLLVVFHDGTTRIADLTAPLAAISESIPTAALHHLPAQYFPVEHGDRVCFVDDMQKNADPTCEEAVHAALDGDGRVLFGAPDGNLSFLVQIGSNGIGLPQYRIPTGARYEIVSGLSGDHYQFLILVTQGNEVRVVNPVRPDSPIGTYATWEQAGLRAMFELAGSAVRDDAHVRILAQNLVNESRGDYNWSFFRIKPEIILYAPVLEFAPNEPAYPSDVNIWDLILPASKGSTREDYQTAYDSLGPRRFSRCSVYYRAVSYPGSWLIEFWYYYPFDEGKPHRHIHDSEHVFIEVDKLGGKIISYVASDHGSFAPNNGYSTLLRNAKPITLPLFAMVEFEKHAMAPDLDRSGTFTRGVDENIYPFHYEAWGVRDVATQPQHLMKPYKPSMTLPRQPEDRLAMREARKYFPDIEVPQGRDACGLVPLPDEATAAPPAPRKSTVPTPPTAQAGMAHLLDHPDALHPTAIYKPWVLPYRQLRLGMALFDHNGNHDQLYAAYAMDIPHLTRNALPIPFRVAFETMWSPSSRAASFTTGGHTRAGTISSEMYLGARFEGFYSHTQGYYFGVTPQLRRFTTDTIDGLGVPHSSAWQYGAVWYRAGYMFELPSRIHGNMTHHVGVVFHGSTIRIEWRISFGVLRQRGRDRFGLSPSDPSP